MTKKEREKQKEAILKKFKKYYDLNPIVHSKRPYGYKVGSVWCAGVSSVARYAPKDYLVFWAAKMVTEYLKDKQEDIKGMTKKQYLELLDKAKKQHSQKTQDAADIGTKAHDWVESYIKGKVLPIPSDIKNPVKQFLDFEKKHSVDWITVERLVGCPKYRVAGRVDSLLFLDGKLTLGDFKTSNQVSEDHFLQTAGYQLCLEEMDIYPEQRLILRLPKTKNDEFEAVLVPTEYKYDRAAFLNRRFSWQWANYVDGSFKKESYYYSNGRKQKIKKLDIAKYKLS